MEEFEVLFNSKKIKVERFELPGQVAFRLNLHPERKNAIIARITKSSGERIWTSIPEGDQHIASLIGPLIDKYYKSQKKD